MFHLNVCLRYEGCNFHFSMHLLVGDGFALGRIVVVAEHAVAKFHHILESGFPRIETCFSEHIDYFYECPDGCK